MGDTTRTMMCLAQAIDYPEALPEGVAGAVFRVDGLAIQVLSMARQTVLRYVLACPEEALPTFAQYAAGRFLRESATLAWDDREGTLFLWEGLPGTMDAGALRAAFEAFVESCEWWQARVSGLGAPATAFPDILIKP